MAAMSAATGAVTLTPPSSSHGGNPSAWKSYSGHGHNGVSLPPCPFPSPPVLARAQPTTLCPPRPSTTTPTPMNPASLHWHLNVAPGRLANVQRHPSGFYAGRKLPES